MKKVVILILMMAVAAWGCSGDYIAIDEIVPQTGGDVSTDDDGDDNDGDGTTSGTADTGSDTDKDADEISGTTFAKTITVTFGGSTAVVSGDDSGFATVSGNGVTVINTGDEIIKYVLTGSSSSGFFKLYSNRKQAIVLNDLNLTNPSGAAINNQSKKRTFVVLEGASKIADGSSYTMVTDEDQKAAFFSEGQLVFSGDGSLTVTATGKAGITSDDYVAFLGTQTVSVNSSAGHGIRGKEYIKVADGTIDVTVSADMKKGFSSDSLVVFDGGITTIKVSGSAAYDEEDKEYSGTAGVKADQLFIMNNGTLKITNSGTGGKGISCDALGYFNGGTVNVSVSGSNYTGNKSLASDYTVGAKGIKFDGSLYFNGSKVSVTAKSHEAIESKGKIQVNGGEVYAYSSGDDSINAAGDFTINDGYLCGISTANDGLDANGNFYIKGGVVYAVGKSSPEVAIDANTEGGKKLYVQGGTLFAIGGLESGASLTQSCYSASSWSKNANYALTVGSDTYVFKTPASGGSGIVVSGSSTPTLKSGVTVSGGTTIFGGYGTLGATVSGGSSVSLSSYSGGTGGPGGGPGGRR